MTVDWKGTVVVCVSCWRIFETPQTIKVVGEIKLDSFRVCASFKKCLCAAQLTTMSNTKTDLLLLLFVNINVVLRNT